MIKLDTVITYLEKIQKMYELHDTPLKFIVTCVEITVEKLV